VVTGPGGGCTSDDCVIAPPVTWLSFVFRDLSRPQIRKAVRRMYFGAWRSVRYCIIRAEDPDRKTNTPYIEVFQLAPKSFSIILTKIPFSIYPSLNKFPKVVTDELLILRFKVFLVGDSLPK
jgi:hypothetical protein